MGTGTDITLLTQQSYTAAQTIINLPIAISVLGYVGRLQKLSGKHCLHFINKMKVVQNNTKQTILGSFKA